MKKYVIAGVLVVAFVLYLVFFNKSNTPVTTPASSGAPTSSPNTTGPTSLPTTTPPSGNPPTGSASNGSGATTASAGQYKDGTYTGTVADAFYGNLQAAVTIQNGMITDVTFPQAPSGGHSSEVSAFALPMPIAFIGTCTGKELTARRKSATLYQSIL